MTREKPFNPNEFWYLPETQAVLKNIDDDHKDCIDFDCHVEGNSCGAVIYNDLAEWMKEYFQINDEELQHDKELQGALYESVDTITLELGYGERRVLSLVGISLLPDFGIMGYVEVEVGKRDSIEAGISYDLITRALLDENGNFRFEEIASKWDVCIAEEHFELNMHRNYEELECVELDCDQRGLGILDFIATPTPQEIDWQQAKERLLELFADRIIDTRQELGDDLIEIAEDSEILAAAIDSETLAAAREAHRQEEAMAARKERALIALANWQREGF